LTPAEPRVPDTVAALGGERRIVAPASLAALLDWLSGRKLGSQEPGVRVIDSGAGLAALPADAAVDWRGLGRPTGGTGPSRRASAPAPVRDLADVAGEPVARRAAEICAAGGRHLMLLGPGVGNSMLGGCGRHDE
jgi:magnesium chelatase family protein